MSDFNSTQLHQAAKILLEGGLVVLPTDTVYGLAALAEDVEAVAALYRAKERPPELPLPVMLASPQRVPEIAQPLPGFWQLAERFWPGPLTIILPKTEALPAIVTSGRATVGLRIPQHHLTLALLRLVDAPLAVTSANLSGQPPALTASQARAQLAARVDFILDGGPAPGREPSTIVDLTQPPFRILRPGPITETQIREALTEH